MSAAEAPRTEPRASVLFLLALVPVFAAYANAPSVGFMWDDHVLIVQNAELHELHAPWTYLLRTFWQHPFVHGPAHAFYRPLIVWTLALDWQLGGGQAAWFHVMNVAWHLGVCALVFWFALRRGQSGPRAAVVTALFGVMPRLTESVTWIVGRTDVIATFFVLLAAAVLEQDRRWLRRLSAVLLLLALLSKEVALVGALLLLGAELRRKQRDPVVLSGAALAVVAWAVLRAQVQSAQALQLHDVPTFLAGLGEYAWMTLTPWHPVAQLGLWLAPERWAMALGAVALVAVGALAWRWRRVWKAEWLVTALGALVLVTLPVLTVHTLASDRFLYLPFALGAVLLAATPLPRVGLALTAVGALALALVTSRHNERWGNELAFWAQVKADAHPRNPAAYAGLADVYLELSRLEDARALYVQALAVEPNPLASPFQLSLAVADSKLGHDAQALAALQQLVADHPDWKRARFDEVLFRARALDVDGARRVLAALEPSGDDAEVLQSFDALLTKYAAAAQSGAPFERALALSELGATRKAQAVFEDVVRSDPVHRAQALQWLTLFGSAAVAPGACGALAPGDPARDVFRERFSDRPDLACR